MQVKSSELQQGDVVLCHGMRCQIDRPIESVERDNGTVYFTAARVLNRDEITAQQVPLSFTAHEFWNEAARRWERDYSDPRWTIQGNDFARWSVER